MSSTPPKDPETDLLIIKSFLEAAASDPGDLHTALQRIGDALSLLGRLVPPRPESAGGLRWVAIWSERSGEEDEAKEGE
jgi:hypothetical protein